MCLKENSSLRCAQVDMEERIKLLETQVINLRSKKTQREKESRQLNLIVKGLPQKDNEKVFVTMRSLIDKLGLSFSYSATHGAYRMGGANRNAVYPRPIKWFLTTRQQKAEIFGVQYKLKDNDVFKKVRLVNDYAEDELLEHREASQLSGMANRQGINARVKRKESGRRKKRRKEKR